MLFTIVMCLEARPSKSEGLKQLDRISRRIVHEDLLASVASHDVIAKSHSRSPQFLNSGFEIIDFDLYSVPTAGTGELTIRHCLSRSSRTRPIKQQLQISSRQARETWRRMHPQFKAQHVGIEG